MYFWDYNALAHDLKNNKVTTREKLKYLIAIMIYVPTGIMGSNWIPGVYRFIYTVSNKILSLQNTRIPPLKIFHDYNYFTDILTIIVIIGGLALCYWINRKGDGKHFVERVMCLSIPITIRISIYVLCVFLLALGASLAYFYFKLRIIAQVHGFLKAFKQLKRLKQLMPLMAFISYRMHVLSCILALSSVVWGFFTLRREIKFVARAE